MGMMQRAIWMMVAIAVVIVTGCDSRDQRLVEVSERSAERQREQNELIARQNAAVTQENQRITDAAKELVEKDAEARREMIQAQRELSAELSSERSNIDRQREELESERREIAAQRGRDPIIAETVNAIGVLIACLVPLVLAAFALSRLAPDSSGGEELCELLVQELVSENPALLPSSPNRPAIEGDSAEFAAIEDHEAESVDEDEEDELPF